MSTLRGEAPILAGDASGVIAQLREQARQQELTAEQHKTINTVCQYLENKQEFLIYDEALRRGWPIASGVIEGAARHLIADRLDITGSRWSVEGAEAVLVLRAIISSGDFETYWQHHIDQEHRRLYPGTEQHGYPLTA